ncbi:MAG: GTP-binding protein [Promethearchaeota archaeon]
MSYRRRHRMPTYKAVLLGDGAVGKTSLRERFMGKDFTGEYTMTIGADFAAKPVTIEASDKKIMFQIWDLAGQPRFEAVRSVYYQGSHGALLVYDVTRRDSFNNTPKWIMECWKNSGRLKVPLVVLSNKSDLRNQFSGCVTEREGRALAKEISKILKFPVPYFETSALTGLNVDKAFASLGKIIEDYREQIKQKSTSQTLNF